MKIKDMTSKTSLEVQDTDLLIIEDEEDTKSITVGELKNALNLSFDTTVKKTINNTIDKIVSALQDCKYILSELHSWVLSAWIDNEDSIVQIAIKDTEADKWLTAEDICLMTNPDENGIAQENFDIFVKVAGAYYPMLMYTIGSFNDLYPDAQTIDAELYDAQAGFLRVYFQEFTHNEIAGITFDDIKVVFPETEHDRYEFTVDDTKFYNTIPYIEPEEPQPEEPSDNQEENNDTEQTPTGDEDNSQTDDNDDDNNNSSDNGDDSDNSASDNETNNGDESQDNDIPSNEGSEEEGDNNSDESEDNTLPNDDQTP